jgi:hypothetical protein
VNREAILGPRNQFAENMEQLLLEGSSACNGKVAPGAQTLRLGQTLAGEFPAWPLGSPAPFVSRVYATQLAIERSSWTALVSADSTIAVLLLALLNSCPCKAADHAVPFSGYANVRAFSSR